MGARAEFLDAYKGSFVDVIDPSNFDEKVISFPGVVLVQFYTSWSPNCKKFAPRWVEAAEALKAEGKTVRLALLDADTHREFARRFKVDTYPTVVSFGKYVKERPTYNLPSDASVDDILEHVKELDNVTPEQADEVQREILQTKEKGSSPTDHKRSKRSSRKHEAGKKDGPSDAPPPVTKRSRKEKLRNDPTQHHPKQREQESSAGIDHDALRHRPFHGVDPIDIPHAPPLPSHAVPNLHDDVGAMAGDDMLSHHHRREALRRRARHIDGDDAGPSIPHPIHHNDDWEERRKSSIPPRTAEDDERHRKIVDEHWERVRQRKEEREARRGRGETNEHDDMYFKHEKMISDARRRHDDHMAEVMKRHEEVMSDVQRRLSGHREEMDRRFGASDNGGSSSMAQRVDELPGAAAATDESADGL